MRNRLLILLMAAVLLPSLWPKPALAHKVSLFAYHSDGRVFTESYFTDGTPCRNARITAKEDGGRIIAEGVTDGDGFFSFPWEDGEKLRISLNAGDGHGDEFTLEGDKRKGGSGEGPANPADPVPGEKTVPGAAGSLDEEAVGRIIEGKIAPLRESVDRIRRRLERPTLERVVGGLGWIVGLTGAYLWGISTGRRDRKKEQGRANGRNTEY